MMGLSDRLLHDIEHHCNNFFNPHNAPDDPQRDYPDSFLELAHRIQAFNDMPANFTGGDPEHPIYVPWQTTFERELSIYKRAKFI